MQRPTGVTILAVLGFVGAATLFAAGLMLCLGGAMLSRMANRPMGMMLGMGGAVVGAFVLFLAGLYLVTSIGLLTFKIGLASCS
jgi:hypothetical protein